MAQEGEVTEATPANPAETAAPQEPVAEGKFFK